MWDVPGTGEEEQLDRLRVHLETAQRIAFLGSWVTDIETGALEWSPMVHRIFGWPVDEPVSYDAVVRAVHPDDRRRLRTVHEDAVTSGEPYSVEYRILHPDGELHHLREEAVVELDAAGSPQRFVGVVQDVTQRTLLTRSVIDTESRRRELLHRVIRASEQERAQLAADLHDGPIQLLTVAAMRLEHLRMTRDVPAPWLDEAIDAIRGTMVQLRDTLYELRPTLPSDAALDTSVTQLAATILPAVPVEVALRGEEPARATARELLGLAQEVLWGVRESGRIERVDIEIDVTAGEVAVDVVTHGSPPAPDRGWRRIAFLGVVHRTEALGGTCTIDVATDAQVIRCRFAALEALGSPA